VHLTAEQGLGLAWILHTVGQDCLLSGAQRDSFNRSPWLHVDYPTLGRFFCILDATGAVYETVGEMREIPDDPVYMPLSYSKHVRIDRLLHMLEKRDDMLRRVRDDSAVTLPNTLMADISLLLRDQPEANSSP